MFHVEHTAKISVENCPLCQQSHYVTYLELDDYFLTNENFSILKCTNCGLLRTNPQPSPDVIGQYYDSPDYISHSIGNKSIKEIIYDLIRKRTLSSKLNILNKYSKGNRLLDIGCATGVFLNYCQQNGYSVNGVEPDEKCRIYAALNFNIQVDTLESLVNFPENSFDVITMWHVLEHVSDINERMSVIKRLLTPDGVLIVALPNPESFDANHYGKYWAAFDVPRHLFHFTKETFRKLCAIHAFEVINIIPMIYDSYYISLLSEKYMNGKTSFLKAFLVGLKSNLKARNNTNHSSIIYIIRNK
jgi:2-polyprenyl-3-methyl-5-hydroxy-6-metoxy-1,4-benzoquinol methylase